MLFRKFQVEPDKKTLEPSNKLAPAAVEWLEKYKVKAT